MTQALAGEQPAEVIVQMPPAPVSATLGRDHIPDYYDVCDFLMHGVCVCVCVFNARNEGCLY